MWVSVIRYVASGEPLNALPSAHLGAEGLVVGDCAGCSLASKLLHQQEKDRMLNRVLFLLGANPRVG